MHKDDKKSRLRGAEAVLLYFFFWPKMRDQNLHKKFFKKK